MEPLRIAHVDAEKGFSGGEVQVFLLMEGLRERGHENVLVCPPRSRAEAEAGSRKLETIAVRMSGDLDLGSVPKLKRAIESWKPDLVHLHTARATWLGGLAAKLAKVPAITTRRMDKPLKQGWRQRLVYGSLVERAVAISPAVEDALPRGRRARAEDLDDPEHGRAAPRRPGREAAGPPLARVGRQHARAARARLLVRRKGIDVLLEALARFPASSSSHGSPARDPSGPRSKRRRNASASRRASASSDGARTPALSSPPRISSSCPRARKVSASPRSRRWRRVVR
jgi:hypothetical protein